MNRLNISEHPSSLRAKAVTVLACLAFWGLSQQTEHPPDQINAKVLIEHLTALSDSDQYEALIQHADSIAVLLDKNHLRADWYKVLWMKTLSQVKHKDERTAIVQLLPIVQAQTIDDNYTNKLYGLLGYVCLNAREFDLGAWYYEKYLSGLLRRHISVDVGVAYLNLGVALKEQGDFRAARQYYLTAIPLLEQEGNAWNLSEALINLGDISRYLFEFETAREYYRRAALEYPEKEGRLASNLGWSYADEGRYHEALEYFQESCRQGPNAEDLARIMAHCSETLGDTTEANRQYKLALESAPAARDSAKVKWYIGNTLLQRKQPEAALKVFQQALQKLFPSLRADNPRDNPQTGLSADFWPVQILRGKAQAFRARYAHKGAVQDLHLAWSAVSTAVAAIDTLRTGMRNETSGQDAVDYAYSTYETAIQIALDLEHAEPRHGHLASAYEMAEHAKSNALKTSLREKDLRQSAQLPDSLLWQEKTAMAAVAFWEEAKRPDSLLAAVRRLEQVRSKIEKQTPLLSKTRTQTQNVPIATIQNSLKEGELLLQYFWGDSTVIVFSVGKRSLNTHSIPRNAGLDHSLDSLRAALTNWRLSPAAYSAYAASVYQQFCAPLLEKAGQLQRLIIVPDGPLWAVPFEALTSSDGRFLLQDHAVSYHWSSALWWQARKQAYSFSAKSGYGGFAPQYPAPADPMATLGGELGDLPEARAAVVNAALAWGGTVWQGPSVDKKLFQREAGKYGILHLAMHGLLDKKDRTRTGLAFPASGDSIALLNTLEISQMDLSAQLAVLSACNTGSGLVYRGEGVMGLSRAFALAGCPALTANLWEVPSRETNDITAAFLTLLKGGKSKDEALRTAKLDFLEHAESERRHPFFWAGQVLIGNEAPIQQSHIWIWALLSVGLLGGLGRFAWQRWRRPGK